MQDVECPIKGLRLLAESPYPTLLWRFDPVGCARSLFLFPSFLTLTLATVGDFYAARAFPGGVYRQSQLYFARHRRRIHPGIHWPGVADFCGVVVLNESAKILWTTLLGGATTEDLTEALVQAFQVSPAQAQADVEETLVHLDGARYGTPCLNPTAIP